MLEPRKDELLESIRVLAQIRALEMARRFWMRLTVALLVGHLLVASAAARITTCLYQRVRVVEKKERAWQIHQEEEEAIRQAEEQKKRDEQRSRERRQAEHEIVQKAAQWLRQKGAVERP